MDSSIFLVLNLVKLAEVALPCLLIRWAENFSAGIDSLSQTGARTKFLSCEPLTGPIVKMNLDNIDWVIAGGENGLKSRAMNKEWVVEINN